MTQNSFLETVLTILVTSGVTLGGVYGLGKGLIEKWLDQRFAKQQQDERLEHAAELVRLKAHIDVLLDRNLKLGQREFELCLEVIDKTAAAYWSIRQFVSSIRSHPDINAMTKAHQESFVDQCSLHDCG